MKKTKKLLKFENDINIDCVFGDMVMSEIKTKSVEPVKRTIIIDNKNKNNKNVGIF